ncbi:CHAT domain-containing protein [Nostoc sp. CHAB 5824]|nr:CHAT domain-containing protein [Nostoc sp. CHAB 5824]
MTKSPVGEGETESSLPFFEGEVDWRMTLLRTLEMSAFNSQYFQTAGEQDWMVKSGILSKDISAFHPNYIANIGQELYKSLFPLGSKVKNALLAAQQVVDSENKQLHIQLKFEADVVQRSRLADYPWELLHDGEKFLLHQQVTISRYIAYNSVPPNLAKIKKLNVLLISSPASDSELGLHPFESKEQKAIRKGLKIAQEAGYINFSQLDDATVDNLRKYLTEKREDNAPHVLHFDGHGLFGKRCSHCGAMNKGVQALVCRKCGSELPQAQGYLVFEDEDGDADYISAEELGILLRQSSFGDGTNKTDGVTLTVLSACQSAMTFIGDSVFNGTAQNLISHRIPAVVAMQYSVGVQAAAKFAEQFYQSLGQKNSLTAAISQAREAMGVEGNQWYRPILYLRWRDNEGGQLFAALKSGIGIPFQAPPKLSYYVDRQEYSQDLKARLLTKSSSNAGTLESIAIHGMGSVGKSTLVAGLAHDPEVRKHFCDGILWATLGQEPKILELLGGWVQALGDYNQLNANEEVMSKRLGDLLQDKAVLLIVDDAWNTEYIKYFKVGGSRCKILVTTRESAIAKVLGASIYSLDVMKPEQAMELLTNLLRRNLIDLERQEAEALAKAVGYLPLALELAAAQVKGGIRWAVLLQDLQQEVARLKTFDDPEAGDFTDEASLKRFSLTASLNLSIQRLPEENRLDFTWLGVLPEDVNITQMMTATLWDMDERDAFDRLRYLGSKALLLPSIPLADGTLTYRLHDLLHDLARNLLTASITPKRRGDLPGLGLSFATAQVNFLQQYRQKTQKNLWHTLPNDGYIHQRLVWHLEKAERVEEIHQLLREESQTGSNGWFEAREKLGQTEGYITDFFRAWKLAEENWTESTLPQVVGLQCRYALITASLNSLAGNLPEKLLVALVKNNVWAAEQGLAYAQQKPEPEQKVNSLTELVNYLPPNLKELALQKALVAAREIQDERYRADALIAIAEKLPEVLPDALAAAKSIPDERNRADALIAIAEKLPEVLPEALIAASSIPDERYRTDALIAIAEKLSPELLLEALAAARSIESEYCRAEALSAIVDQLPPELLPEALAAVREIQDERDRADALRAIAEKLPEVLPEALAVAKSIPDEYCRANALRAIAEKLPEVLPEALAVAKSIPDEYCRAEALSAIIEQLPPELLPEALAVAREILYEHIRANALRAIAEKIPEVLPEALAAARSIQFEGYRAEALRAIVDQLPPELLPEALAAAKEIQDESDRANALSAIVDQLPPELLPEALAAAKEIQDEYIRANALSAIADKLPPELLPEALAATRAIQDERYRVNALSAIPNELPAELLPEALAATRAIQDERYRANTLSAIAEKLPPELLPEALAIVRSIQYEGYRTDVLKVIAEKLPPELLPEALAIVREIYSEEYRTDVLKAIAEKLPPELLPEALTIVRSIPYERYRANDLIAIAEKLPPELLPEALAIVRSIQDETYRANALIAIAEKLPLELLPEALAIVRSIPYEYIRAKALKAIAEKLPPELLPEALTAAKEIQDNESRSIALRAIAEKLPPELLPEALAIVRSIPYEYIRAEALRTIAEKLSPELLPEALAAAREIQSKHIRANALSSLINKLPELSPEALAATKSIEYERDRADALKAIAEKLPAELLPEALAAAREIYSEEYRADALKAIAEKLPAELLPEALAAAREIQSEYFRADVLKAIAEKLPAELLPEALAAARSFQDEKNRAEALSAIAEKLPEVLPEALAAARSLQDEKNRAEALSAIAEKLPEVLPEALATIRLIKPEYIRIAALRAIAEKLPPELLPEAVAVSREIQDEGNRAKALTALTFGLSQMPSVELFSLWQDTLRQLSLRTRPDLLQDIEALFPVIFALGGQAATAEIARAIVDVGRWWR